MPVVVGLTTNDEWTYPMTEPDDPVIYPIPLSDGKIAKLQLPRKLRKEDAEKIARVVVALAHTNGHQP